MLNKYKKKRTVEEDKEERESPCLVDNAGDNTTILCLST